MDENKREIIPLNEIMLDPNLSVEELEERLEMEAPWICGGFVECGIDIAE